MPSYCTEFSWANCFCRKQVWCFCLRKPRWSEGICISSTQDMRSELMSTLGKKGVESGHEYWGIPSPKQGLSHKCQHDGRWPTPQKQQVTQGSKYWYQHLQYILFQCSNYLNTKWGRRHSLCLAGMWFREPSSSQNHQLSVRKPRDFSSVQNNL